MQIIKPERLKQTIYFDVDDTLIFEALPDDEGAFKLNNGQGWFWYRAHVNHLVELKKLYLEKNQIIIWTQHELGAEWAYQVAKQLGLQDLDGGLEIYCMAKPDRFYDDVAAEEVLHPSLRRYLAK